MLEVLRIAKLNRNAKLYLIYRFINSLWFIEASWYFFWGEFLSYSQIGVVFSWLVVLGILAEIPTGVIADKWGRKASVILGTILLTLGGIVNSVTRFGWELVIGTSLMSIGRAFISGALEAMVYDSMKKDRLEKSWDKLMNTRIQLSLVAYSTAVPIGGFAYSYFFRLPNILETLVLAVSIYIATQFVDSEIARKQKFHIVLSDYLAGFKQLFSSQMRPYIITSFLIITTYELYDWGLSKPAMALSFGFDSRGQSIIYTALAITNILFISTLPRIRRLIGDYYGLIAINIINGLAFILSAYIFGYVGLLTMLAIELGGNLGDSWTSTVTNEHTDSKHRATTISTLAFIAQIPHFFVNILAGSAIDGAGIGSFHRALGATIIGITTLVWILKKRPI